MVVGVLYFNKKVTEFEREFKGEVGVFLFFLDF